MVAAYERYGFGFVDMRNSLGSPQLEPNQYEAEREAKKRRYAKNEARREKYKAKHEPTVQRKPR